MTNKEAMNLIIRTNREVLDMAVIEKSEFDKWFSETYPGWYLCLELCPESLTIRLREEGDYPYQFYSTRLVYGMDYMIETDLDALLKTTITRCFDDMKERKNDIR